MKNKYSFRSISASLAIAAATTCAAGTLNAMPLQSAEASDAEWTKDFQGVYKEANTKCDGYILSFIYDDDGIYLGEEGLFDLAMGYRGSADEIKRLPDGISIKGTMNVMEGMGESGSYAMDFKLTEKKDGGYDLQIISNDMPNSPVGPKEGTYQMYKLENDMISGAVPAKIGDKVTIAGLIKSVAPYLFRPEMMATCMYLKNPSVLSEGEIVRHDERNRFLDYSCGMNDTYMECKYWNMSDGNVLLVVNFHDGTYQYPQSMRFFKFNRKNGTMEELETALSAKWPLGEEAEKRGICYQVRYSSDGIVALVPQKQGDSFDIVTLKFDGTTFR